MNKEIKTLQQEHIMRIFNDRRRSKSKGSKLLSWTCFSWVVIFSIFCYFWG